jgi:hypothetical protein
VRLDIGVVGAEQLADPGDRQFLGAIHEFAAAVVALARIALGVLVGKHAALRLHHQGAGVVLGGDEFEVIFLTARLRGDGRGEFGVEGLEREVLVKHGRLG